MIIQQPFTIAIQRRGKLRQGSQAFLRSLGVDELAEDSEDNGVLKSHCHRSGVTVLYVRDDDIPEYVKQGAADFGIVGTNVLLEKQYQLPIERELDFGACKLVLAVPQQSGWSNVQELAGERIATSYPYLLKQYLKKEHVAASIITIQGSVEVAPELNIADAVCDLTQTGGTLAQHKLVPIATLLTSQAVVVRNPATNQTLPYVI